MVPGQLEVGIRYCDGGEYKGHIAGSHWGLYPPKNILRNDLSVYCSEREACNIILEHEGSQHFALTRLIIKTPRSGFTAPLQEGMVFIALTPEELLSRTFAYKISPPSLESGFPPGMSQESFLHEISRYAEIARQSRRGSRPRAQYNQARPPSRRRDNPPQAPGYVQDRYTSGAQSYPYYHPNDSRVDLREPIPSFEEFLNGRRPTPPTYDPEDHYPGTDHSELDDAELDVTPDARPAAVSDTRTIVAHAPPSLHRGLLVSQSYSDLSSDEEVPTSHEVLEDRTRRQNTFTGYLSDSEQEEERRRGRVILHRSRSMNRRFEWVVTEEDAQLEFEERVRRGEESREDVVAAKHRIKTTKPLAPHARFFVDRRQRHVVVNFQPAISGRFILLKLFSPMSSKNIDVQTIMAFGYTGPRYFPAVQVS